MSIPPRRDSVVNMSQATLKQRVNMVVMRMIAQNSDHDQKQGQPQGQQQPQQPQQQQPQQQQQQQRHQTEYPQAEPANNRGQCERFHILHLNNFPIMLICPFLQ